MFCYWGFETVIMHGCELSLYVAKGEEGSLQCVSAYLFMWCLETKTKKHLQGPPAEYNLEHGCQQLVSVCITW